MTRIRNTLKRGIQLRIGRIFFEVVSRDLDTHSQRWVTHVLDNLTIVVCGKARNSRPLIDLLQRISKETGLYLVISSRSEEKIFYEKGDKRIRVIDVTDEMLKEIPRGLHTENIQIREMQALLACVNTRFVLRLRKDLSCSYEGLVSFIVMARAAMALRSFVVSSLSSCPMVDFCASDILVFGETSDMNALYSCPFRDLDQEQDARVSDLGFAESWLWGNYYQSLGIKANKRLLEESVYVVETKKYGIYFARESSLYLDRYIAYMTEPWLLFQARDVIPRHYHASQMSCICGHKIIEEAFKEKEDRIESRGRFYKTMKAILRRVT